MLGAYVVFTSLLIASINLLIPGVKVVFSLGYSMCGEKNPHLDFLTLKQTDCSITPGDALVVVRSWPPEIGDVACVNTNVGIVCHRVVSREGNVYVVEGDYAKWKLPFTRDAYFGKVVAKIPRLFSLPVISLRAALSGDFDAVLNIDRGSYQPFQ